MIKIRTKFITSTIIVAIGILLIAGAINTDVEAVTPTQISDCGSHSSADGERLVLTKDIGLNDDCIVISHDNVTLDCNGFMIDGVSDTGIGVKVMADGVTVKNCTIRNFSIGINLVNSDGSTITKNTLILNDLGIDLESSSDDNTITANNLTKNDLDGIIIESSNFNKIARNTFLENKRDGIRISNSDNNIIRLNISTDNALNGIRLFDDADSNTIKKNTSNNNGRDGISVCDECNSNILTLNTANSNGRDGFVDTTEPLSNTYKNNMCSQNTDNDSMPSGLCS